MSYTYITECTGCCSGTGGCPTFSGCVGFPKTYSFVASGFKLCSFLGVDFSILNGNPWYLNMPAPLNPYLCSWINSGNPSATTDPTWILAPSAPATLNCPNGDLGSGGSNSSGAFFLRAFSPTDTFPYIGYLSSGCLLSGSWNCSGPNTLYYWPYYNLFDSHVQYDSFFCSGDAPPSLTVVPIFT